MKSNEPFDKYYARAVREGMASGNKIVVVCGKICSGKTTYAKRFCHENRAILLSVDEIMLTLFGGDAGDMHDYYAGRTQCYLFDKSCELVRAGVTVVLDWGFWTRKKRNEARQFYISRGIPCEFHYLCIDNEKWKMRIQHRNDGVLNGKNDAYYIDEGLIRKFDQIFEYPEREEIDLWIEES